MQATLDVDQLKTFLAIADGGNFTRAAEAVNKTQSAVSMQMKRLEETVGRPIFIRDGRVSKLTADGEKLVDYARKLVSLNDEAVTAFSAPEITGTVRFGTPDDYADLFLPEILARFGRSHPQVNVDVECHPSVVLNKHIRDSVLDLAVVTFQGDESQGESLMTAELHWVTSQRHAVHTQAVLPVAAGNATCKWREQVSTILNKQGRKYRLAYSSPNYSTINAVVMQGLAVAAMPAICLKPGMRILSEAEGFPSLGTFEIGLITRPGRLSKAAAALAQHVRDGLGSGRKLQAAE